jgi:hypothetical protein
MKKKRHSIDKSVTTRAQALSRRICCGAVFKSRGTGGMPLLVLRKPLEYMNASSCPASALAKAVPACIDRGPCGVDSSNSPTWWGIEPAAFGTRCLRQSSKNIALFLL